MTKIEIISKAVNLKKPISFEYNLEGKVKGERIGNPHALYIYTSKQNQQSTKLDIIQTGGATDTPEKPFPKWASRLFVDSIENVKILENAESFQVAPDYNPNSSWYNFPIAKI